MSSVKSTNSSQINQIPEYTNPAQVNTTSPGSVIESHDKHDKVVRDARPQAPGAGLNTTFNRAARFADRSARVEASGNESAPSADADLAANLGNLLLDMMKNAANRKNH